VNLDLAAAWIRDQSLRNTGRYAHRPPRAKTGLTRVFAAEGNLSPVTVSLRIDTARSSPCAPSEKDGLHSLACGIGTAKSKNVT